MAITAANAVSAYVKAAGRGLGPGMDAPTEAGRGEFAELGAPPKSWDSNPRRSRLACAN